jgi:hypothetical protein
MVLAAAVALGLAATPVAADRAETSIDITSIKDQLVVLRAGGDEYVALVPFETSSQHFYYGNSRAMYRQQTFLTSTDEGTAVERVFWSPVTANESRLVFDNGIWTLRCGDRELELDPVANVEAERLLGSASFREPRWKREAYLLARDAEHHYYYIDHVRSARGGSGFRLFIGKKGRLNQIKLADVVRDSEGEIFVTARGELHVETTPDSPAPALIWKRRGAGKATVLLTVPVERNPYLIYQELGVYAGEQFGTPCEQPRAPTARSK